jgi:signal peptidase I
MEISREDFENFKRQPFFKGVIVTDSMTPLIKVGDRIVTEVGYQNLKRFDIIVIYLDGKLVCHYLWAMNRVLTPILFQTRNLKNGGRDIPISFDDYLGKVVSHKLSAIDKFKIILRKAFRSR